jgi:hypothetical protein
MVAIDTMDKPYRLFIIGLILTTTATLLLYKFIPTYNLLGGQWSVYLPGEATPHAAKKMSYTNTDILIRLAICNLVYWSVFILTYAGLRHLTRIRFQSRYLKIHFTLSLLAFVFVICLNNKVTFASTYFNSGPSDIYISGELSKFDMSQINSESQFRTSLTSTTSLIGIGCLVLGIGLFLVNINKGLKRVES